MKKKIYEEHNIAVTFKDRLKRGGIENILKGSSQVIRRNIRRLLILLAVASIGFMTLSQIATFFYWWNIISNKSSYEYHIFVR